MPDLPLTAQACVVVVGAGHGGVQLALRLRAEGFEGRLILIGDEPGLPYQRPPLSKDYLGGRIGEGALAFRPAAFYSDNRIELLHGKVAAVKRGSQSLLMADGSRIGYTVLVLATGAANRRLDVPGFGLGGILPLRTLRDAETLRTALARASKVVVIGAGFIGLEFTVAALSAGKRVDVVDVAGRPMERAVSAATAAAFQASHVRAGARFHLGCSVESLVGVGGMVAGVRLDLGPVLEADLVVYGIGVVPRTELAASAGLTVSAAGIRVDEGLCTDDPAIYAIGDVAEFPFDSGHCRIESVQNAADQARCVAAALTGQAAPYDPVPWFWSDQHLRLQIAGLARGCDEHVVVGSPGQQQFSVLCFRAKRLLAVESVNRPADHMAARRILASQRLPGPADARQPGFELKAWASATHA